MPVWFWLVVSGVFGLIIGSFLNVVIYRFHTGRSLSGHSHCLSCGRRLAWYELVPVLSYLLLRGRCQTCGAYIPWRYLLVEALTAIVFMLILVKTSSLIEVLWLWLVLAILIVGAVYDLYHLIIPDEVAISLGGLGLLWVIYQSQLDLGTIGLTVVAAGLGSAALALLWFISSGRWLGLGDAKLFFGLGLLVGPTGVFSLLVLAFWIGASVALIIIFIQRLLRSLAAKLQMKKMVWGHVKMKSEIPFAPFLIVAWLLVFLTDANVINYTAHVTEFLYSLF